MVGQLRRRSPEAGERCGLAPLGPSAAAGALRAAAALLALVARTARSAPAPRAALRDEVLPPPAPRARDERALALAARRAEQLADFRTAERAPLPDLQAL